MKSELVEVVTLLRLLNNGEVAATRINRPVVDRFHKARWIVLSTKRDHWSVRPDARDALRARLQQLRPSIDADVAFLRDCGLDVLDVGNWQALPNLFREKATAQLLHRKNWNAAAGSGSKRAARTVPEVDLTDDWLLRVRSSAGFTIRFTGCVSVDVLEDTRQRTECGIPERLWRLRTGLEVAPGSVAITCENLGAFVDVPLLPGMVIIFSPGRDTSPAAALLQAVPTLPWAHFGDLDDDGVDIAYQLARQSSRPPRFYVPSFAADLLESAKPVLRSWRSAQPISPLIQELVRRRRFLEQELFVTDPRFAADFAEFVERVRQEAATQ